MRRVVLHIDGGRVQGLLTDAAKTLLPAHAKIARVSHVEPVLLYQRVLFHLLRSVFGEDGRIGCWLRTWKCRWRVNFGVIGGGVFDRDDEGKLFADRQAAIDFEIPRANQFLKEGTVPC